MIEGFLYTERLNLLNWKGCGDLWRHKGMDAQRCVPNGFHTLGVPGILASLDIEGDLNLGNDRLDDLVRGYVGERWAAHGPDHIHDPIFILSIEPNLKVIQIAVEGEQLWLYDDPNYGWVSFSTLPNAAHWIKSNS